MSVWPREMDLASQQLFQMKILSALIFALWLFYQRPSPYTAEGQIPRGLSQNPLSSIFQFVLLYRYQWRWIRRVDAMDNGRSFRCGAGDDNSSLHHCCRQPRWFFRVSWLCLAFSLISWNHNTSSWFKPVWMSDLKPFPSLLDLHNLPSTVAGLERWRDAGHVFFPLSRQKSKVLNQQCANGDLLTETLCSPKPLEQGRCLPYLKSLALEGLWSFKRPVSLAQEWLCLCCCSWCGCQGFSCDWGHIYPDRRLWNPFLDLQGGIPQSWWWQTHIAEMHVSHQQGQVRLDLNSSTFLKNNIKAVFLPQAM